MQVYCSQETLLISKMDSVTQTNICLKDLDNAFEKVLKQLQSLNDEDAKEECSVFFPVAKILVSRIDPKREDLNGLELHWDIQIDREQANVYGYLEKITIQGNSLATAEISIIVRKNKDIKGECWYSWKGSYMKLVEITKDKESRMIQRNHIYSALDSLRKRIS